MRNSCVLQEGQLGGSYDTLSLCAHTHPANLGAGEVIIGHTHPRVGATP